MSPLRPFIAALLMLSLIASGFGMAMARGAMAADGQLCSVTAPAPIVLSHDGLPLFDGAGDPVELARTPCPDCVIGALALAAAPEAAVRPAATATILVFHGRGVDHPTGVRLGGEARGPPCAA